MMYSEPSPTELRHHEIPAESEEGSSHPLCPVKFTWTKRLREAHWINCPQHHVCCLGHICTSTELCTVHFQIFYIEAFTTRWRLQACSDKDNSVSSIHFTITLKRAGTLTKKVHHGAIRTCSLSALIRAVSPFFLWMASINTRLFLNWLPLQPR